MTLYFYSLRLLAVCLTFLIGGCISVPTYKEGGGKANILNFKYGKYCGKGHPNFSSKIGSPERTKDLNSTWPPVDDVDLLCYVHDVCYQHTTQGNLICDQAFNSVAYSNANAFHKKKKCENLQILLSTAIGSKFFGTEKDTDSSLFMSAANTVTTVPLALLTYTTRVKEFEKYKFPKTEGGCFMNASRALNIRYLVSGFESMYRGFASGYEKYSKKAPKTYDFSAPVPLPGWEKHFDIYEIQKYLNYYGYIAGVPDGRFGNKTKQAILRFQKEHSMQQDGSSTELVLYGLKEKFLERQWKERASLYTASYADKLKRFGY